MDCPKCGGATKVKSSFADKTSVCRLRECINCKDRFTTNEVVSDDGNFYELRKKYRVMYEKMLRAY